MKLIIIILFFSVQYANSTCRIGKFCGDCGLSFSSRKDRILGGSEAIPHSWPSTVRVIFKYYFFHKAQIRSYSAACGGTLIDNDTIITAGHCFIKYIYLENLIYKVEPNRFHPNYASMYTVYAGIHDINEKSTPLEVFSFIQHPNYDDQEYLNDIGVIRLKDELVFSSKIQPACLPNWTPREYPSQRNADVWTLGWGLNDNNKMSDKLMDVKIILYEFKECSLFKKLKNSSIQLCAGDKFNRKDSCLGDSGGPLFIKDINNGKEKFILIGIVSYGLTDCGANYPAIYTKVSSYLEWIDFLSKKKKNLYFEFNTGLKLEINVLSFVFCCLIVF